MRHSLVLAGVWLGGLAVGWGVLRATASRPAPFEVADVTVVGECDPEPLVAIAAPAGEHPLGRRLSAGPIKLWDLGAGRRVATYPVAPAGQRYTTAGYFRWVRVVPVDADDQYGPSTVYDLRDGRAVCRTGDLPVFTFNIGVSGGRVVVLSVDRATGAYTTTAYDPTTGAAVWAADEFLYHLTASLTVTGPPWLDLQAEPTGPWTVRRSADGSVVQVLPAGPRPHLIDDRTVVTTDGRVWDRATGTFRFRLPGQYPTQFGLSPDGCWLIGLRFPPAADPEVCWLDAVTGAEADDRRVVFRGNRASADVGSGGLLRVCYTPGEPGWADWVRRQLSLPPPARRSEVVRWYDADTGRRLGDGQPGCQVWRADGRPVLNANGDGRRTRVWADRLGWLFPAFADGWTAIVALAVIARLWRRRRFASSH